MIIEAGYDILELLLRGRFDPGSLRMVQLDRDLRLMRTRTVLPNFTGTFDAATVEAVDAAIPGPDDDDDEGRWAVRYIALGFDVSDVSPYPESLDWDRVKVLDEWLSCRGIGLLGIQLYDDEGWVSTGPMYSFESYVGSEDLPRVVVVRGPHPFGSCECVACAPQRVAKSV